MKSLFARVALASVLSLAAFGCASGSSSDDAAGAASAASIAPPKTVLETTEARYEGLAGVWGVQAVKNDKGLDLAIVEAGGGDPAMNGDYVYLAAYAGGSAGGGGVFDLGLNVAQVTSATFTNGHLEIKGTQDTIDGASGDIKSGVPFTAIVDLAVANDAVASVDVTQNGASSRITPAAAERESFFGSIFAVTQKETPAGTNVRLFETGGGDPAMNGNNLLLNIMSYPETKTYELGLNVNTVKSFSATDKEIRIEGTQDTMDRNGKIVNAPFAVAITYAIGQNGEVPSKISMQRLK